MIFMRLKPFLAYDQMKFNSVFSFAGGLGVFLLLSGCSSYPGWIAASGPNAAQVIEQKDVTSPIPVVTIDGAVARQAMAAQKTDSFAKTLFTKEPPKYLVGAGDTLEIAVWEAPPAALFGASVVDARAGLTSTRQTTFPEQIVNEDGVVNVPFAGTIKVAGYTTQKIEKMIEASLARKANQPQVLVRVLRNATSNVTVVGEVANSMRLPLTPKGERLLDAVAAAGGVRQPVGKITVQISRDGRVFSMPLESVIQDPVQNVYLQPGDVLTALFQPLSFTVLGATGRNEEINFEAQGISLAQALARSGGLRDNQSDARGIFIFRFEDSDMMANINNPLLTPDGKAPLIYQLNLKDPSAFLAAQNFPMKNKDIVYVANAPSAELQKFLNILTSSIYSIGATVDLGK